MPKKIIFFESDAIQNGYPLIDKHTEFFAQSWEVEISSADYKSLSLKIEEFLSNFIYDENSQKDKSENSEEEQELNY
jgi:hypothetical protein